MYAGSPIKPISLLMVATVQYYAISMQSFMMSKRSDVCFLRVVESMESNGAEWGLAFGGTPNPQPNLFQAVGHQLSNFILDNLLPTSILPQGVFKVFD